MRLLIEVFERCMMGAVIICLVLLAGTVVLFVACLFKYLWQQVGAWL